MRDKMKKVIVTATLLAVAGMSTSVLAGHAVRAGFGVPTGVYGEYEYRMLLNRLGLFASYGFFDGKIPSAAGDSSEVDLTSWSVGARLYLLAGLSVRAGFTGISADGTVTDTTGPTTVAAEVDVKGVDLGVGYGLGLGPIFLGIDAGVILDEPDVKTSAASPSGGLLDVFDVSAVPNAKFYIGIRI